MEQKQKQPQLERSLELNMTVLCWISVPHRGHGRGEHCREHVRSRRGRLETTAGACLVSKKTIRLVCSQHTNTQPEEALCALLWEPRTRTHTHTHAGFVQRVLWMAWSTNVTALCVQVTHGGHIAANVSCGGLCCCKLVLSSPADTLLPCLPVLSCACLNVLRPLHQLHLCLCYFYTFWWKAKLILLAVVSLSLPIIGWVTCLY